MSTEHQYYFIFTDDAILRIPRLPTEVLRLILAYLPSKDLRRVALASREWYDLAHDSGLVLRLSTRSKSSAILGSLRQIVFHALQYGRSPRIALELEYCPRGVERKTGDMFLKDAVAAICYALPYLAVLSIDATCGFTISLCAALTAPARFLHTFNLTSVLRDSEKLPDATIRLDPGLFSRDAPRLRSVTLDVPLLELPAAPIPVFHAVRAARVSLSFPERRMAVERLFPTAEDLTLCTRLTVDDSVRRGVKVTMNPERRPGTVQLDRVCSSPEQLCSALRPLGTMGALDARVFRANSGMAIALRTADGTGSTTLRVPLRPHRRDALDELESLPVARLDSLTVSESLLGELLQTGVTIPALRTLKIDCTPGDYVPVLPGQPSQGTICVRGTPVSACRLLCPALETVVFSADHRFPVRHAQVVMAIGRLLELARADRTRRSRPRLVVSGVTATNLACAMEYFSSIRASA